MTTPSYEDTLQQVFDDASNIATRSGVPYCSGHLLLALLGTENSGRPLLMDKGLSASEIVEYMSAAAAEEPPHTLSQIRDRTQGLAQNCGSSRVSALHLIIVLASEKKSVAHKILVSTGVDTGSLRAIALALATSGAKPRPADKVEPEHETTSESQAPKLNPPEKPPKDVGTELDAARRKPTRTGLIRETAQESNTGGNELSPTARRAKKNLQDPRITRGSKRTKKAKKEDAVFVLDEKKFPTLLSLGKNLTETAASGQIEPLVGRRKLVERILDILGKRRANNPCLVGEPGVGKTAIVEGLAYLQNKEPEAFPFLKDRVIVELNMGKLLSGTQLRGAFSERLANLQTEVAQAEGHVIVFLDEIHTLVGAGAVGENSYDAVTELGAAMAQGDFPCVGATNTENYKKHIEETPALQRRLQPVLVPEPNVEETIEILKGVVPAYAKHHKVEYLPESLEAGARLSSRYIADRFLPDKAISLLDLAGSRSKRKAKEQVGRAEVAELVAESASIPAARLLMTDTERFLQMESFLHERIVGHDQVIKRVCQVVRRNYAGFASNRPIGSFLFLGPTGVGKTELVKVLANFLFQSPEALCRCDMSEYMEPHSVARLIGSPPGYVGHDQGGQLTEAIRKKPYQIVLLDEVEKAHRDVLQILLQLLDEGRLTDGRGRTVDFSNTVVVMTSNLGSAHYGKQRGPIGFGATQQKNPSDKELDQVSERVLDTAKKAFPIELWNRIEERIVFKPLSEDQILDIARLLVKESCERLSNEKKITFEATDSALQYLVEHGGYDPQLGARPMRTTIQRLVEGPVAEQILLGKAEAGDHLRVDLVDGSLVVERATKD